MLRPINGNAMNTTGRSIRNPSTIDNVAAAAMAAIRAPRNLARRTTTVVTNVLTSDPAPTNALR